MLKQMFRIIIVLCFVIIFLLPFTSVATKPVFDLVICSDTTRFNPGEKITFRIYMVGVGNVTEDYLLFYVDDQMYVANLTVMGFEFNEGLQDKGTNVQFFDRFMENAKQGFPPEYSPDQINPLYGGFFVDNGYIPPIEVIIKTDLNVTPGDHDFKIIYMYKNPDDEDWQQVSEIVTFHVNTFTEQHEIIGFFWNFLPPFLGLLTALFIFYLGLQYSKGKDKKRKDTLKDNLSLMIKDEINFNLKKAGQIKEEAEKKNIPLYRLKTENRDAIWNKIVEYRSDEHDLIKDISGLYFKYDLLNRTVDHGFQCQYHKANVSGLLAEIIRASKAIENTSKDVLKKF